MKMVIAVTLLSFTMPGCRPSATPTPDASRASPSTTSEATAAPPERLRGRWVTSDAGPAWTLCGEDRPRRVGPIADSAASTIRSVSAGGTRDFFVDGWGRRIGDGVALERVERVYFEGRGCDEDLTAVIWKAQGNEPFWSLSALAEHVRFDRPGESARYFPYSPFREAGSERLFSARTESSSIDVRLSPTSCVDSMSGAVFSWTAEVRAEGQVWRGCAFRGDRAP
jgi:uncharacterized membrane protein